MFDFSFYKGKKVFITGHTGFKGSWMCEVLLESGAEVIGYSLEPPTKPNLFEICHLEERMTSILGDVRDLTHLMEVFQKEQPEIVIHMAAQPIVREAYKRPVDTYETNVMGTVNVLECIRQNPCVKSFVNVTTDKVYLNREWEWGYRENEELNGLDPYSNSKSCSELVTSSYVNSFFGERELAVSTCRAGNVIGGGDFAADRIIPDCVRAIESGEQIIIRNPDSIRPYQHVLEPVCVYLMIAMEQYQNKTLAGSYNVGPDETDCCATGTLVAMVCDKWNQISAQKLTWLNQLDDGPREAKYLRLDCSKLKQTFGWKPRWNVEKSVEMIAEWTKEYLDAKNETEISECMKRQIGEFLK